jgi:hypothetical protein
MWVATALVTLAGSGCSQKKSASETPPVAEQPPSQAPAPGGHAQSETTATAAGSVQEAWTQIAAEQGKLSAAIQDGQLKAVHRLAFRIRDLVVALADKAGASSPPPAPKLAGQVEQFKASAADLAQLGDAGDLKGAQTEFAKLSAILDAIKSTVGPA